MEVSPNAYCCRRSSGRLLFINKVNKLPQVLITACSAVLLMTQTFLQQFLRTSGVLLCFCCFNCKNQIQSYSHFSIRSAVLQIKVDFTSNLMQKRCTFHFLVQQPPSALTVNNRMCLLGVSTVFWVVSHGCAYRKLKLSPKLVGFHIAVPRRSKAWNT